MKLPKDDICNNCINLTYVHINGYKHSIPVCVKCAPRINDTFTHCLDKEIKNEKGNK